MSETNMPTVQKQQQKFSIAIHTSTYQKLIAKTLQDPQRIARFTSAITSAVAVNSALQDCTPGSILSGALLGESLGLTPSPQLGQYYLVPFDCKVRDEKGNIIYKTDANGNFLRNDYNAKIAVTEKQAQFVLGYKGYIQLAIRSGQYRDIDAFEVREGEYLGKDAHTAQPRFEFVEDDDARDQLPVIGYIAYFEYLNGFRKTLYWTKEKMMAHADQYSAAFSAEAYQKLMNREIQEKDKWKYSSFWYKDFDGMAKKTMLRQLISKWGIMSVEMQQGVVSDSGIIQIDNGNFISVSESEVNRDPQPTEPVVVETTDTVPAAPQVQPGQQVNLADL